MKAKSVKLKVKNYNLKLKTLFKKTKSFTLYVLVFSSTLYTLHFGVNPVYAQSLSLSLWPPLLEVMIQPGRSITQVYKLTNSSDHELQITPHIFSFKPQGENGEIQISSKFKVQSSKLDFFSFESGEHFDQAFYLPIGKEREIILEVSIPKGSPENDYYYTLLFSTGSTPGENKQTSSSSIAQIGTNILLTISQNGQPTFLGRILQFSTPKIIDSFSPIAFTVRLENWGETFWKPFGKIKVTGILKQKDEISLYEQNILAESSRKLDIPEIKPKLPLGPFKASLEFSLGESGPEKLSAETTFWYLPYKAFFALFMGTTAILLVKRLKKLFFRSRVSI